MVEKKRCTGCGACAAACPHYAISMKRDCEGFAYPQIDASVCIRCGRCDAVCPEEMPSEAAGENAYFGARAKEKAVRQAGSSGGIFPLLAAYVLEKGGMVYGAGMQADGSVSHMGIARIEDTGRLTKTKYVQSDLAPVWEGIRGHLQQGRPVLFCGTPCQAAALKAFLGQEYENLLLATLICYGVPSPGIWEQYVRFLEKKYGGVFGGFSFRDKRNGDYGRTVALRMGKREVAYSLHRDLFCRTYFRNINIRPCCYTCRYCTVERSSDITLGDFWGIEGIHPEFDDGMGVSAVICHSAKGKRLWSGIQDKTEWFACGETDVANDMQPRLQRPTECARNRARYMRLYRSLPFSLWIRLFSR